MHELNELARYFPMNMRKESAKGYRTRIMQAIVHLQERLDEDVTLEEIADAACFSPYHFHRIFKAMTGETVMSYRRRLLLERAAQQISYSNRSITEIALDSGYDTPEPFSRAFKRLFGVSPQNYRISCLRQRVTFLEHKNLLGDTKMEVNITDFNDTLVAYVRHTGPYMECGKAWKTLCDSPEVMKATSKDSLWIGVSYDNPDVTPAHKIRYDACVSIPEGLDLREPIQSQVIPGGKHAVYTHVGSYAGLHDCYRMLYGKWFPESGYEPAKAPSFEICRTSPETTPEEELITEIWIPITKYSS